MPRLVSETVKTGYIPRKDVRDTIATFLHVITRELTEGRTVRLHNVGTFTTHLPKGRTGGYHVQFKCSPVLARFVKWRKSE